MQEKSISLRDLQASAEVCLCRGGGLELQFLLETASVVLTLGWATGSPCESLPSSLSKLQPTENQFGCETKQHPATA